MDHDQFEILVAAILTAGIVSGSPRTETSSIATLLGSIRDAVHNSGVVSERSAAFIPKRSR